MSGTNFIILTILVMVFLFVLLNLGTLISFRQGRSLSPGKAPGKRPKVDECVKKLLEADLKERPFAKLHHRCEYLEALAGLRVSRSTLCRALKRMEFTRKKGQ